MIHLGNEEEPLRNVLSLQGETSASTVQCGLNELP